MNKPFLPTERADTGSRFQLTMMRSLIATAQASASNSDDAVAVARSRFPDDRALIEWLERGASSITTTTGSVFAGTVVNTLVPLLGPLSAAGNIFKRSLNLSFGTAAVINIPEATPSGTGVSFIGQSAPFPIRQLSFSAEPLVPRKVALGSVATRELYEAPGAEALLANVLAADFSLGLESVLFDTTASDTTRPAGLKYGISAIAADTGTDITAMFNDLSNLAAVVAAVGGLNFGYIASPKQAVKISLRKSTNNFPYPVFSSAALPDKQVACIAFDALAVAGDNMPRFETSKSATVHMEQSTPTALSTVATPNTVAAPISSLYQQDLIGTRLIADISWTLRSASGFAWINAVNW